MFRAGYCLLCDAEHTQASPGEHLKAEHRPEPLVTPDVEKEHAEYLQRWAARLQEHGRQAANENEDKFRVTASEGRTQKHYECLLRARKFATTQEAMLKHTE